MRAWLLNESPGEFVLGEIQTPEPSAGEVQICVKTSGLNHLDLWVAQGQPTPPRLPHVGGADGAGVISAIGSGVNSFAVGDEVIINPALWCGECAHCISGETVLCDSFGIVGEHCWGTFADYIVLPAHNVAFKPDHRSWEDAGAFALTYMTAHRMLERARVASGDDVLVTGIGGGVAAAAMVLALGREANVTVSSRSREKIEKANRHGADGIIWPDNELPRNKFNVVIDSVGTALWPQTYKALAKGGRFVTCGSTSGSNVELSLTSLFWNQHELIGSTMGSESDFNAVLELFADDIPVIREETIAFNDWQHGFARLAAGDQFGKLVMSHLDY